MDMDEIRRRLEVYWGQKLPDDLWQGLEPMEEEGETLDSAGRALPSRLEPVFEALAAQVRRRSKSEVARRRKQLAAIVTEEPQERQWELTISAGLQERSAHLASSPEVLQVAQDARRHVFGETVPPFASLGQAWEWISSELESEEAEGDRAREDAAWIQLALDGYTDLAENETLKPYGVSEPPPWPPSRILDQLTPPVVPFWLGNLSEAAGGFYMPRQAALGKPRAVSEGKPDEGHAVVARTTKLALLALWARWLMETTGVWTNAQCSAFILTGQVPEIPRYRAWVREGLDGVMQCVIELYASVTYREMMHLHTALRKHRGEYKKKGITPEDLLVLEFVERTPTLTWQQRFELWNEKYPGSGRGKRGQYKSYRGLYLRYQRILERVKFKIVS